METENKVREKVDFLVMVIWLEKGKETENAEMRES